MKRLGVQKSRRNNRAKIDLATGRLRIFDDKKITQEYCELFNDEGDLFIKLTDTKGEFGRGVHRHCDAILINIGYRVVRDFKLTEEYYDYEIKDDSIRVFLLYL